MGNLESTDGGPGEPPSVPLLLPPGKTPMPEPCELEERFALVLVRPALPPSRRPPPPAPAGSRPPPQPRRGSGRRGPQAPDLPEVQTRPPPLPSDFPVCCRNSIPRTSLVGRFRKLLGPQPKSSIFPLL